MAYVRLCTLMYAYGSRPSPSPSPPTNNPAVIGKYEYLGTSYCVGVQLVAVPGTDNFLFMERPTTPHPDGKHANAGLMDFITGKFTNVACKYSMENCGHTFLENGHKPQSSYPEGRRAVQVLDVGALALRSVGQLQFGHWLATVTRLPNGMVTVMSDSPSPVGPVRKDAVQNPFYELWDPSSPATTKVIQMDADFIANTKYFYYPFVFVLPTGDMFVWSNTYGQIIEPMTGRRIAVLPTWKDIPEAKGMNTAYPFSGSAVLLPLRPEDNYQVAEIVVFGGQWSKGWVNTTAVDLSMRLKIKILEDSAYEIGEWQMERMPLPRVSGSAVLLPNGQVLLINGAKRGLLGDAVSGGGAMLNEPNFWPVLYDPTAPEGSRYTTLGRSQIARLLHSTAGLTLNGTVIVAGGDRSSRFWSPESYSPSPNGFPEFRVELFTPPFMFDTDHRPVIVNSPTVIGYDDISTIVYTMTDTNATITSVVLVAPPSDTHAFNMHQRLIELAILAQDKDTDHEVSTPGARTVTVRGPPNANVAPQGPYMLFLLHNTTYGPGKWRGPFLLESDEAPPWATHLSTEMVLPVRVFGVL
ncbi:glyoxal or galactose oxidase [Volvox carteri f. nagariensis]|uniref:Glyoxal or galactose oxidase n=1 Tax=Volvox carteri f. nagariensis TaxID=3068 RepID=D8U7C8_VOLCA|nr:glyoxal or galactose oxidase [Volvox carteri f. nagariensis]EFJ44399.1 glyoxal or galactose oxidase [Volvox carteri f. nagariensis]|eukprot:XP_002954506.1 glyoxal or galactose oxidase [Volvox carteri f. nagariensis]